MASEHTQTSSTEKYKKCLKLTTDQIVRLGLCSVVTSLFSYSTYQHSLCHYPGYYVVFYVGGFHLCSVF